MCPRVRAALSPSHLAVTDRRDTALLSLIVLVVLGGVAVGVGVGPADTALAQSEDGVENLTTDVQLQPDGDADWTIELAIELESTAEIEAFRETATRFENGEESLGVAYFRNVNDQIDGTVDRQLSIDNVARTSQLEVAANNTGVGRLVASFTWTNFAEVEGEGDELVVGDVLAIDGQPWFERLGANERLIVRAPPNYGVRDSNVEPDAGTLRWEGPVSFDETSLAATFVGDGDGGTNGGGDDEPPAPPDDSPPGESGGLSTPLLWGGGLAAAAVVGVVAYLLARREEPLSVPLGTGEDDDRTPEAGGTARANGDGTERADPEEESDDTDGTPPELLSDEERVEQLLEANGGRMKQAAIVEETGWSNAKVSQLLSEMNENDRIQKLRIGRENLIAVPDEDVLDPED